MNDTLQLSDIIKVPEIYDDSKWWTKDVPESSPYFSGIGAG